MDIGRVTSSDGTAIAFERVGTGAADILVDAAGNFRGFSPLPALAAALAPRFTVVTYDRRGKGAVALYARRHEIHRVREVAPGAYTLRHCHDTDGHRDESNFLTALAAHPAVAQVERTTHAEDEAFGVDALVSVRGQEMPVAIDVTTRGRTSCGYVANLLDTLRRGVVPVVIEHVPTDLAPDAAFAAFAFWWHKSEAYFAASTLLVSWNDVRSLSGRSVHLPASDRQLG